VTKLIAFTIVASASAITGTNIRRQNLTLLLQLWKSTIVCSKDRNLSGLQKTVNKKAIAAVFQMIRRGKIIRIIALKL
jgi:hypothetical protein